MRLLTLLLTIGLIGCGNGVVTKTVSVPEIIKIDEIDSGQLLDAIDKFCESEYLYLTDEIKRDKLIRSCIKQKTYDFINILELTKQGSTL